MTKSETREVQKIIEYGQALGIDYMARAMSALYRAARTSKSKRDIVAATYPWKVWTSKEWIV